MAALRGRVVAECLTTCIFRQTNTASISVLVDVLARNKGYVQRSQLHTGRGSRDPLTKALFGCQNHGRLLLLNAVAIRHNSTQIAETVQSLSTPSQPPDAPLSVPVSIPSPAVDLTLTVAPQIPVAPSITVPPPITEQVTEAPLTALDVLQEVGVEASLSELGLCSYTPVGLVQNILEFMHVSIGLPWWGAIVAGTIIARCAVFPVIVKGQREAAKLNNVLPEMTKLNNRMTEAKQSGNKFEFSKAYTDLMLFQKKKDVNPLRGFLVPLVQAPVFISFFIALRKMADLPVPSLQTGGLWWFTDLTASDPYYVLPVMVTATMLAILETGAESGVDNPNLKAMKTVFRFMPFVILPFTIHFPTAVFTYWMTSNAFSLVQVSVLKHPAVRRRLRIPERIIHPASAMPNNEGFLSSMKKGWKNAKVAHQLQERERRVQDQLEFAAKGPLKQTFAHNPLQQSAMSTRKASSPRTDKKRPWEETIG